MDASEHRGGKMSRRGHDVAANENTGHHGRVELATVPTGLLVELRNPVVDEL